MASLLVVLALVLAPWANAAGKTAATILFFNDIHGYLEPFTIKTDQGRSEVGGVARMMTLIKSIKTANQNRNVTTLVLIAGDILQGTPMSTIFKGRPDVACFNAMGVDAMTVGNHEFDFGFDNFMTLKKEARFPFLSANIAYKASGQLVCAPFKSFPLSKTVALTVIGITTADLATTTKPGNVKDLSVLDAVKSVRKAFVQVKHLGPVVLLSHSRHKTDRAIAKAVPGLAAIIGGHDHILMQPLRKVGNVPILQAFEKGRYLGRIDMIVDEVTKIGRLDAFAYLPVDNKLAADPQVAAIVKHYNEKLGARFKEVVGKADVFLDARRQQVRYVETNLGNFVADIVRANTGADIALINSGAVRCSINAGAITLNDIYKTIPFSNEIVLMKLSGADIRQMLKRALRGTRADEDGGFLQVSGLWFTVQGKAATSVQTGNDRAPLENDRIYKVALTDFMAEGGDDYVLLAGRPLHKTGLPLRELLVETIRAGSPLSPKTEGRIVRINP